jgi:PHD/YefM family antitoxin component YafN of YafNO toxin-antitoxin module
MFDPIEPLEPTSLDDFVQQSKAMIERLKKTGQPQVLTVDGKAAVVVQDVTAYRRLIERIDRAETVVGIRQGLEEAARGKGLPVKGDVRRTETEPEAS